MTVKPYTDPDIGKTPEQLFAERTKRIEDVLHLKQPDRIPIQLVMGYMIADMYGVTHQEQHENAEKSLEITEKAALRFQPGRAYSPFSCAPTQPLPGRRHGAVPRPRAGRQRVFSVRRGRVHEGRRL